MKEENGTERTPDGAGRVSFPQVLGYGGSIPTSHLDLLNPTAQNMIIQGGPESRT